MKQKKVFWSARIISKLRHCAPSTLLLILYFAILHPHLLHSIIAWESNYKSCKDLYFYKIKP